MRATLRLPRASTYAEYLAVEEHSEHRHELIDGVIVAMAGGSDEHNAIAGRLAMLLGVRLGGRLPLLHGRSALLDRGDRTRSIHRWFDHPREARAPPHDGQATTNPRVVVEVLSPSSEGDDDGDKRLDFQSLASLEAYVLFAQDARRVQVYRRDEQGRWSVAPEVYGRGESFALPSLLAAVSVDDVYHDVLDEQGRSLLR